MLLGLLADIHEHTDNLRRALDRFAELRVDCTILLGDIFDHGQDINETCRSLIDARPPILGVWGNHDFGLCDGPDPALTSRFPRPVLQLFALLKPRLTLEDCFFQHIEPWLDPRNLEDLWQPPGDLLDPARTPRALAASPARVSFMGHHHRWIIDSDRERTAGLRPTTPLVLDNPEPITLAHPHRWFVHLGAVCENWAATYDTESALLSPVRL